MGKTVWRRGRRPLTGHAARPQRKPTRPAPCSWMFSLPSPSREEINFSHVGHSAYAISYVSPRGRCRGNGGKGDDGDGREARVGERELELGLCAGNQKFLRLKPYRRSCGSEELCTIIVISLSRCTAPQRKYTGRVQGAYSPPPQSVFSVGRHPRPGSRTRQVRAHVSCLGLGQPWCLCYSRSHLTPCDRPPTLSYL